MRYSGWAVRLPAQQGGFRQEARGASAKAALVNASR